MARFDFANRAESGSLLGAEFVCAAAAARAENDSGALAFVHGAGEVGGGGSFIVGVSEPDGAVLERREDFVRNLAGLLVRAAQRDLVTAALVIDIGNPLVMGHYGVRLIYIEIYGLLFAFLFETALLSRRQRAVVVLHYSYGYTLDECSRFMGCRPGTARQHLARALTHLRETLNDAT